MTTNRSLRSCTMKFSLALALAGALSAAELPKGEAILDKYVEVTGGKAAYARVHSEVSTGTMEFKSVGLKGRMTAYTAEPGKRYTEMDIEGVGKMSEGTDGDVAWSMSAMQGNHVKEGDERAESLLQAKFNADLNWRDQFKSAETAGIETVDGKECYKVLLVPKSGGTHTRWYDKDSNLLVKMSMTAKTPMGELATESVLSDYRKEGDILMPHKIVSKVATMEIAMIIDSVKLNPEIPKDRFDIPDEIKALLKKAQ